MTDLTILAELKKDLEEILGVLREDLTRIRTGRPTPALVEDIPVEAYGMRMRVKELATIRVPEPRQLLIEPWDRAVLDSLGKALIKADLGTSPIVVDGAIRIIFPTLTGERREVLVREMGERIEKVREQIRKARQVAREKAERLEATEGEDAVFRLKEEIDKLVKLVGDQMEDLKLRKEEEIRTD